MIRVAGLIYLATEKEPDDHHTVCKSRELFEQHPEEQRGWDLGPYISPQLPEDEVQQDDTR